MNLRSNAFLLSVIVALHLVLGLAYAFVTPYRTPGFYTASRSVIPDVGAPDERQHVNYIQWLVDGKGFPVFDPKDPQLGEHYQSHQPPLFYLLETGVAKVTGQTDLSTRTAGSMLRSFNVLIGCGTVVGVYFLAFWGFRRGDIALTAAAFTALLPMNLALSGAVSNDPLLYCLCTWCLAVTALGLKEGWTLKRGIAVGLLMGLAFLTKTTALALIPALLVTLYFSGAPKPSLKVVGVTAAIALILAVPWWLRNQSLYGDLFAMKAFNQAFVGAPTREMLGADWRSYIIEWVGWWTARSFIGMFGYMDIRLPVIVYQVGLLAFVALAVGGLLALRQSEWKEFRPANMLNAVFLIVVVVLFAGFNVRFFQGQARYLFPALGPISIGLALGLVYFSKKQWKVSLAAWMVVLVCLNLYVVARLLPEQFARRTGAVITTSMNFQQSKTVL
jgi:4-amino-4-deoxy-L-arabinose transferase-like glycosyltransferase